MGNCQTVDAASLVIQHPNGKQDIMYCPVLASEIMRMNPGHYVSLITPLPIINSDNDNSVHDNNNNNNNNNNNRTVRFSSVKLLRANDTLLLGRAYRLVTTQEVMKVIRAKKHANRSRRNQSASGENLHIRPDVMHGSTSYNNNDQDIRTTDHRGSTNLATGKSWRPSLLSISESGRS